MAQIHASALSLAIQIPPVHKKQTYLNNFMQSMTFCDDVLNSYVQGFNFLEFMINVLSATSLCVSMC